MVASCSIPSSTIKKKHNYISYRRLMESMYSGVINLSQTPCKYKPYGILTKYLVTQNHYPLMKELLGLVYFGIEMGVQEFGYKSHVRF